MSNYMMRFTSNFETKGPAMIAVYRPSFFLFRWILHFIHPVRHTAGNHVFDCKTFRGIQYVVKEIRPWPLKKQTIDLGDGDADGYGATQKQVGRVSWLGPTPRAGIVERYVNRATTRKSRLVRKTRNSHNIPRSRRHRLS